MIRIVKITPVNHRELLKIISTSKVFALSLAALFAFGCGIGNVFAQTSPSVLYVPLIGITSVPEPLVLPAGAGNVTYSYAVKNFLSEVGLTNVRVVDDMCSPVKFLTGDDDFDSKLDYTETWRYACTTRISTTTRNTATVTGTAYNINTTHRAYSTVVVGSDSPAPLVSIINITKIAYPFSLPVGGGEITFTYKVNNPGIVPLGDVVVVDDKCRAMSGKLGDVNQNNLLDVNEVWIYTCTASLVETTTNTVNVSALANGLRAFSEATITVTVDTPIADFVPGLPGQPIPSFPETGMTGLVVKISVWAILSVVLVALIMFLVSARKKIGEYSD
ncbi:MAG: hypothetical protein V1856_01955 [Candidatus Liptonbacteria bacterium]